MSPCVPIEIAVAMKRRLRHGELMHVPRTVGDVVSGVNGCCKGKGVS
jgi:hypothetical protein